MGHRSRTVTRATPLVIAGLLAAPAMATDIEGVLPAALDQPRVNALLRRTPTGDPLHAGTTFNPNAPWEYVFNAFLDTGASGHLLSNETAGVDDEEPGLGVVRAEHNGTRIVFEDVGGGGTVQFNVSEQLHLQFAHHTQNTALADPFFPETFRPQLSDFGPVTGPVRTQVGPVVRPAFGDPLQNLDVIGMPAMLGKVVVMDNRGLNNYAMDPEDLSRFDVLDTYIYNPGTPFNPVDAANPQASENPGIPNVDRKIKLSYASFDSFSKTTPTGAPGPTLAHNPFVGKDPVRLADGVAQPDVPGIRITRGATSAEGNWLLDTGAGASFISKANAAALGVQYAPGREPGDPLPEPGAQPLLVDANGDPIENQFTVAISAFGADDPNTQNDSSGIRIAGFFLDSMLIRTEEGDAGNNDDPDHLRFLSAPVLVFDISVQKELAGGGSQTITLDGILGMNFFAASAFPVEDLVIPPTAPGAFSWIVYDEAAGTFGVQFVPEPGACSMLLVGAFAVLARRRRRAA